MTTDTVDTTTEAFADTRPSRVADLPDCAFHVMQSIGLGYGSGSQVHP